MAFYFTSLYLELKANDNRCPSYFKCKTIAVITMLCSIFIYNLTIPFFLLNPFIIRYLDNQNKPKRSRRYRASIKTIFQSKYAKLLILNIFLILPVIILKLFLMYKSNHSNISQTLKSLGYLIQNIFNPDYTSEGWGLNYLHALMVAFGEYGIGLPFVLWDIISSHRNFLAFSVSLLLGSIIFAYIRKVSDMIPHKPNLDEAEKLSLRGLFIFLIGYGIFLFDWGIQFTATGSANINSITSSIGVSFIIIAFMLLISCRFTSKKYKKNIYSATIATISMVFLLINLTLSNFWVKAYEYNQQLLQGIKKEFPVLPKNSKLILDGFKPYIGPAAVVNSKWTIYGALSTIYQTKDVNIDIITLGIEVKEDGIYILDNAIKHKYPYENLYIYNNEQKKSYQIENARQAQSYINSYLSNFYFSKSDNMAGFGFPVFKFKNLVFK
jgi:hypothetical protein